MNRATYLLSVLLLNSTYASLQGMAGLPSITPWHAYLIAGFVALTFILTGILPPLLGRGNALLTLAFLYLKFFLLVLFCIGSITFLKPVNPKYWVGHFFAVYLFNKILFIVFTASNNNTSKRISSSV